MTSTDWAQRAEEALPRHLTVTTAAGITMKATRWLWEQQGNHWLPMGSLVGLGGREGVGKSTWCAWLIAQLTTGKLYGDHYGKRKGVIVCATEDDWATTIKPRLAAAGADMSRVYQVRAVGADGLEDIVSLPDDLVEMEQAIRDHDVALVVLDPLLTHVNKKLDTHKDAEIRRALEPVVRMAHDTRASVIGLIHVNKTSEGDLMNRLMASRAIGAVVRGVLFCANYRPIEDEAEEGVDPDEPKRSRFVFGQIKNNLQAKVMQAFEYHMEGVAVGYDDEAGKEIEGSYLVIDNTLAENVEDIVLDQEKRKKSANTEGGKALAWLVGYLAGKGEVTSSQVLTDGEAAQHSRSSIHRARLNLGDRIAVVPLGRRTTWKLV